MNFKTATQPPVVVTIDGTNVSVPRMTLDDWVDWGAEVDKDRQAAALAGFGAIDRFKILSVSAVAPSQIGDLANLVFTPAGARRIVRTCMKKGGVADATIAAVLSNGDPGDLQALAEELASVVEKPVIPPSGPGALPADQSATFGDAGGGGNAGGGASSFAEEGQGKERTPLTGSAQG